MFNTNSLELFIIVTENYDRRECNVINLSVSCTTHLYRLCHLHFDMCAKNKGDGDESDEVTLISDVKNEATNPIISTPVIIVYIRGFAEELKRTFGGFGVLTYFKHSNILQQLLVHPKDPCRERQIGWPSIQDKLGRM